MNVWHVIFNAGGQLKTSHGRITGNRVVDIPIHITKIELSALAEGCITPFEISMPDCPCNFMTTLQLEPELNCSTHKKGSIAFQLDATSTDVLNPQFSIDYGRTWNSQNVFKNLSHGKYWPAIKNDQCLKLLDSIEVQLIDTIQVYAELDPPTCDNLDGGSIRTRVTGGDGLFSYQWSTGSSSPNLALLSVGEYQLNVRDSSGCNQSTLYSIDVKGKVDLRLDSLRQLIVCDGSSYTMQLPESFSYIWAGPNNFKNTQSNVTLKDSGWYHIYIFNSADCMHHDSIHLTYSKDFFIIS